VVENLGWGRLTWEGQGDTRGNQEMKTEFNTCLILKIYLTGRGCIVVMMCEGKKVKGNTKPVGSKGGYALAPWGERDE